MRDFNGCLWWILGIIGWFLLWGICISIGDEYKISPFTVLFLLVISTVIAAVLGIYIYTSSHNKIYNRHWKRVNEIQRKYGLAYKKFISENNIKTDCSKGKVSELSVLKKISCREESVWEQEEKSLREEEDKRKREREIERQKCKEKADRIKKDYPDGYKKWEDTEPKKWLYRVVTDYAICDAENDIKSLDQQIKNDNWQKDQAIFANHCRELRDELLNTYGCYLYYIQFDGFDKTREFEIWQLFPYSFCLEEDLDYTHFPTEKKNGQLVKDHKALLPVEQADAIAAYINRLNKEEKTNVYFCPIRDGWDSIFYNNLSTNIIASLDDSVDFLDMSDPLSDSMTAELSDIEKWISSLKRRIVVIDLATDYHRLITCCKEVLDKTKEKRPLISFISVQKGFSREEMVRLIDADKKKRKEEAKRVIDEAISQKSLVNSVSSWDILAGGLHYAYLFYYYPTKCDFEATEEEWSNRWIVWDFKNTPGKTSPEDHQTVLDKVIPMIKKKLLATFQAKDLKYLTLACIPASSQAKTQARYLEFSNRLCSELGMVNAYPHISVISEKEEKHLGGSGLDTSKLHFDEEFFKEKYVLLFDDIITKGNSMITFMRKMESLGATVIGGLCLGKTKHERPTQGGISSSSTQPFPPQPTTFSDNDFELPF